MTNQSRANLRGLLERQAAFDEREGWPDRIQVDDWHAARVGSIARDLAGLQVILLTHEEVGATIKQIVVPGLAIARARIISTVGLGVSTCETADFRAPTPSDVQGQLIRAQAHLAAYVDDDGIRTERARRHEARRGVRRIHVAAISLGHIYGINVNRAHREWLERKAGAVEL